jgi:hypothetical protein
MLSKVSPCILSLLAEMSPDAFIELGNTHFDIMSKVFGRFGRVSE